MESHLPPAPPTRRFGPRDTITAAALGVAALAVGFAATRDPGTVEVEKTVEVPVEKIVEKVVERPVTVNKTPDVCITAIERADRVIVILTEALGIASRNASGPGDLNRLRTLSGETEGAVAAYTTAKDACRSTR